MTPLRFLTDSIVVARESLHPLQSCQPPHHTFIFSATDMRTEQPWQSVHEYLTGASRRNFFSPAGQVRSRHLTTRQCARLVAGWIDVSDRASSASKSTTRLRFRAAQQRDKATAILLDHLISQVGEVDLLTGTRQSACLTGSAARRRLCR